MVQRAASERQKPVAEISDAPGAGDIANKEPFRHWRHKAGRQYYGNYCHRSNPFRMTTFELDHYVVDVLLPDLVAHDRAPSALLVYLLLWRRSRGAEQGAVQISLLDIATATGLSKRAVQVAVSRLVKRRLLSVHRESVTAVPVYTVRRPWAR